MKVLILEDEFLLAMMLAEEVVEAGHTVLGPVSSVAEALRLAEATPPDLAFLNITLSGGELGTEAAVVLKERWDVLCLFVSGSRGMVEEYRSVAVGILEKPYSGDTVHDVLRLLEKLMDGEAVDLIPAGLTLFTKQATHA